MSYKKLKKILNETFHSGFDSSDGLYGEIFKNPTLSEFKKVQRESSDKDIRFYLTKDDNLFIWDANKGTHELVADELYEENLTIGGLYSSGTNGIYFDTYSTNKDFSEEEIRNIFKNSRFYKLFQQVIGREDVYIDVNYVEPYDEEGED